MCKKNSGTGDGSFFVLPERVDGKATKYFREFSKGAEQRERGKERVRMLQTPEGLSFFTQDVVYIVDRPFNLPKLILEGLFGSSLYVWSPLKPPFSLYPVRELHYL